MRSKKIEIFHFPKIFGIEKKIIENCMKIKKFEIEKFRKISVTKIFATDFLFDLTFFLMKQSSIG